MVQFVLVGGVAAVVGFFAGILFGSSIQRIAVVAGTGVVAAACLFVLLFIAAEPEDGGVPCHDCHVWHGRYMDVLNFLVPLFNGVAWVIGAAVGGLIRLGRHTTTHRSTSGAAPR